MMKAALFTVASADVPLVMDFATWQRTFGMTYNSDDELQMRREVYAATVAFIETENAKGHDYVLGVNQFSALTEDEFVEQYTGVDPSLRLADDANLGDQQVDEELADAVDWTTQGVVNPVKNQGSCGSCWAFSTVGTLESAYAIATGNLPNLAEQQLVDCDKATGNQGCSGGWPYEALTHYENHGACTEGSYTYTATDGSCKESSCTVGIPAGTVTGYQYIDSTNDGLKTAVAKQPVSVCVKADSTFQSYRSGVLSKSCSGQINHAVIAVGYSGTDYFKIRNSWGSSWGEGGYIRLAQNDGSRGSFCLLDVNPVVPKLSGSSVEV